MPPITITNPYSGQKLETLNFATDQEIQAKLEASASAFDQWRRSPSSERAELLHHIASELKSRHEEFARLICHEAGKPIHLARVEVDRAIFVFRWAASEAQRFGGEVLRLDAAPWGREGFGIHTRFPRGPVLGITPFNFPLNLVAHKIAPAVASGCSILIKPSPHAPLTALRLAELFAEFSNLPDSPGSKDVVQVVLADDAQTARLTQASEIAMVSFTGSAKVGGLIRAQSPAKPCVLELGGNAWAIVAEDVPSAQFLPIARKIATGAFGYAGQSCISVQNVAVAKSIWTEFSRALVQATEEAAFGDTEDSIVISGPVINDGAARRIKQILENIPGGASTTVSRRFSGREPRPSSLLPPTLVTADSVKDFRSPGYRDLVQEEVFGPVMTAAPFDDADELITIINEGHYGLQVGVFTQNLAWIQKLYRDLRVGGLMVNEAPTNRYDHQPYGGAKDSGQGREGIRYAMEEMSESKFLSLG